MTAAHTFADGLRRLGEWSRGGWREWRNRIVADPRFQRAAADLPLIRRVATANAADLFDLCAGFVYSQILLAGVRLGLFDILASGPLTLADLAPRLGLASDPARRLVEGAVAIGLLERRGGGLYGLSLKGAALRGTPGLVAMIEHHALVYADLADPVALLQGRMPKTGLSDFWPYADGDGQDRARAADYSRLMSATQGFVREDVFDAYPFGRHRRVLDVGGGDGTFLEGLQRRHPHLDLRLFDLPPVAEIAAARFARGPVPRPVAVGGDFRCDALPGGADLVTFVRILHDHDDDRVRALLRKARAALVPGGRLLIAEPMAGPHAGRRVGDAYFAFYLLAMGRGRARDASELKAMMEEAGFARPRLLATRRPLLVSALVAERGV